MAAMWWRRRAVLRNGTTEPPKPAPGLVVGPPDFVGVGVQRAGTSWWFDELATHPDVYVPADRPKELHFFDVLSDGGLTDADIARYHAWFARPPGAITGEWTPSYVYDPWPVPLLAQVAPSARCLLMLRDPVDRFASGLVFQLRRGRSHPDAVRDAFQRGLYASQVARLLAHFPREQVLVLTYEEARSDPHGALARTCEFLGLDPGRLPGAARAGNPHGRAGRIAREVSAPVRAEIAARYRDDIAALSRLLPDLDVERWPSARGA